MFKISASAVVLLGVIAASCAAPAEPIAPRTEACSQNNEDVKNCANELEGAIGEVSTPQMFCDAYNEFYTCIKAICSNPEKTIAEYLMNAGGIESPNCPECQNGTLLGIVIESNSFSCNVNCPTASTNKRQYEEIIIAFVKPIAGALGEYCSKWIIKILPAVPSSAASVFPLLHTLVILILSIGTIGAVLLL